jgi:hypothetical protein
MCCCVAATDRVEVAVETLPEARKTCFDSHLLWRDGYAETTKRGRWWPIHSGEAIVAP